MTMHLSPSLPQCADALAAKNLVAYLQRLDAAGLARLAGALQAECTARSVYGAIAALGTAAGALEDFARERPS